MKLSPYCPFLLSDSLLPVMLGTIRSMGGQNRERAIITTIFPRSQRKERPQLGFLNGVRALMLLSGSSRDGGIGIPFCLQMCARSDCQSLVMKPFRRAGAC